MAFGTTTQSASGSGTSGDASATLSVGATAGNLLVFAVARSATASGGAWGSISGFTAGQQSDPGAGNNMCGATWWKIATGGETAVSTSMTTPAGNWTATIVEYEGPFAATPLDVSAQDATNVSTTVTSQSTGTTGTTAQADALAVGMVAIDSGANFGTTQYSNSFVEVIMATSGVRAGHVQAKKILSATGTVETTLSYSAGGTADEMYGCVLVWKKDTGGGAATPHGPFGLALHGPLGRVFG